MFILNLFKEFIEIKIFGFTIFLKKLSDHYMKNLIFNKMSFNAKIHSDWEIKKYKEIKSYVPPKDSVPLDVVPGVYEGGFQLWECTLDLLDFMENSIDFSGKSVFELGCGRGLPAIYAALHGASKVVLQDYNKEVIEEIAIPNTIINECPANVCEFSADPWKDIPSKFPAQSFDVILAAETIYRKEQLQDFVSAFTHLVKPDGIVVVAAKRFYFGLSGSVLDLIELIEGKYTHELKEYTGRSAYTHDVIVLKKIQQ